MRKLSTCCIVSIAALSLSASAALNFVDKPMVYQSSTRYPNEVVDHIVLHCGSDVFAHPDKPFDIDRRIAIFKKATESMHYVIDRDGTVYRLVSEDRVAWQAGKGHLDWDPQLTSLDQRAIGIQLLGVGSANDMSLFGMSQKSYDDFKSRHPNSVGFTDAQYKALTELIAEIRVRHPAILHDRFHIIGHEEWAGRERRTDPGELFDWTRIDLTQERRQP